MFHCMKYAPHDKVMALSANELKHFKTDVALRHFAEDRPLEQRLLMLIKLGYQFCVLMSPDDKIPLTEEFLAEMVPSYVSGGERKLKLIDKMIKKNVFCFSSKEIMIAAHMAAQNSHLQVFVIDHDFQGMSGRVFPSRVWDENILDAMSGFDMLSNILTHAFTSQKSVKSIANLDEHEMRVLLAMYPLRNNYVTVAKLTSILQQLYRGDYLKKLCIKMDERGLIHRISEKEMIDQKRKVKKIHEYTIMDEGINCVLSFMKYIVKKSLSS